LYYFFPGPGTYQKIYSEGAGSNLERVRREKGGGGRREEGEEREIGLDGPRSIKTTWQTKKQE
jgi:hypothetical protein